MIRTLIKRLSTGLLAGLIIAGCSPALPAHAQLFKNSVNEACQGTQLSDSGSCDEERAGGEVNRVLRVAVNIFSWVVGIIAVIMIIIGGLKYITSAGDSAGVNSAKNTILYAIVGLVIVFMAQILVRFVINRAGEAATPTTSLILTVAGV